MGSLKSHPQTLQVAASKISDLHLSETYQASSTYTSSLMAKETWNPHRGHSKPLVQKTSSTICTFSSTRPPIVNVMPSSSRSTFHACNLLQTLTCFVTCASWVIGWQDCISWRRQERSPRSIQFQE